MQIHYNAATGGFYLEGRQPEGSVAISSERHLELRDAQRQGMVIVPGEDGYPIARHPVVVVTIERLCLAIDRAADAARRAVAGDPLRAVEYERAAAEAQAFANSDYQGDVPPMVAAWAINGRTPQMAADSILAEAAQYNGALVQLRTTRLQAKELIRAAINAGNIEHAQDIAAETIASIEAAVAGIGNNAS